ncbi:MAG: hypothetical protein AAFZ63_13110 [Bacteroidota bacterium]
MVADELGISEGYLSELFKKVLQTSFNDYVNKFRIQHAGFTDDFLADEVHYNEAGAAFIAERYYEVLEDILQR